LRIMDAVYPLLGVTFFGCVVYGRKKWNESWMELDQCKMLQGIMALLIMFHHMAQKTCAPWHDKRFIVHGLDLFVPIGYFFVGVFLFCSGFGLYTSFHNKPNYLKGFFRKRILPIIAAFYLSEWIWLAVRAIMGEQMDTKQLIWYITGLQLANSNAWYVIALPFFYLFFWLAFRFCKSDGWAILITSLCVFVYIMLGLGINHNNWWMRGEWWYNTAHFFPLGLVFARYRKQLTHIMKRGWLVWLILAAFGTYFFYWMSEAAQNTLSYYCDYLPLWERLIRRGGCLLTQIMAGTCFLLTVLLLGLKIRIGNKLLGLLGACTLEIYLIHGIFVDLFGYDFLEVVPSIKYVKDVGTYVLIVLGCTIPAVALFKLMMWPVNRLCKGKKPKRRKPDDASNGEQKVEEAETHEDPAGNDAQLCS